MAYDGTRKLIPVPPPPPPRSLVFSVLSPEGLAPASPGGPTLVFLANFQRPNTSQAPEVMPFPDERRNVVHRRRTYAIGRDIDQIISAIEKSTTTEAASKSTHDRLWIH